MVNVFAIPIFFIVFRETLETSVVVSVLLAFIRQQLGPEQDKAVYKKLRKQVWMGTLIGLAICLVIGCGIIGAFYGLGTDKWSGTEDLWEGVFCIIASIVISVMGVALLRISKMQAKWRVKLARALEVKDSSAAQPRLGGRFTSRRFKLWCEKYAMFMLPFITILREGLEAVVFIGGVSLGLPASSIPLPTITGLMAGCFIGYLIYKGGNKMPLQIFLIISTCFLYLVAAGLFSRAVWDFQQNNWNKLTGGDAAETGSGAGSYDIRQSVWHVNCCNPELNGGGGWGIFNALLGWQNSATYGSVISYNLYWLVMIVVLICLRFKEKNGRWPLTKAKNADVADAGVVIDRKESGSVGSSREDISSEKAVVEKSDGAGVRPSVDVRAMSRTISDV